MIVYRSLRSDEQLGYVAVGTFAIAGACSIWTVLDIHPEIACAVMTTKIIVTEYIK